MAFPKKARFVVIGAGIHGLSTAWHLSEKLKKKNGNGSNNDIVVIDKSGIASGSLAAATTIVRTNQSNVQFVNFESEGTVGSIYFVDGINKKYGDGNLDITSGIFTPKESTETK